MKALYFKSQGFYLIVAFAFFSYALFFYIQNNSTHNKAVVENHTIVNKRCSAAPRVNSFVQINIEGKLYTINLSEKECINKSVGKKITLYYNENHDYFIYENRQDIDTSRLIISAIAFFLMLLPWRYIFTQIKSK
jgi:hypothetical protein